MTEYLLIGLYVALVGIAWGWQIAVLVAMVTVVGYVIGHRDGERRP